MDRINKEINRLISKGMSSIYLNITYGAKLTFSKFRFSKTFSPVQFYGELELTQISLNFKNFYCNLKIRGLGAKA